METIYIKSEPAVDEDFDYKSSLDINQANYHMCDKMQRFLTFLDTAVKVWKVEKSVPVWKGIRSKVPFKNESVNHSKFKNSVFKLHITVLIL